jgi:phytoene synthase
LFAPPATRPPLEALYGIDAEIRASADAAHEVAHARLAWWRGEFDRLEAGRPSHPLTSALLAAHRRGDGDLGLLQELLVAADLDLARLTYQNWTELDAYCFRAAGALQTLVAAVLAGDRPLSASEREFARRLGRALRQVEMLRDFRHDLARGRLYLPLEALAAAGVDAEELQRRAQEPALATLLADWRERVAAELEALPGVLASPGERSTQRHGLVIAALHQRLLERTVLPAEDPQRRAEVPPLTRLWTAWRTAVRHA